MTRTSDHVRRLMQSRPGSLDLQVSHRVLLLMERRGVTRRTLASRALMTAYALGNRLAGRYRWTLNDVEAVAGALGVPVMDLLPDSWSQVSEQQHVAGGALWLR